MKRGEDLEPPALGSHTHAMIFPGCLLWGAGREIRKRDCQAGQSSGPRTLKRLLTRPIPVLPGLRDSAPGTRQARQRSSFGASVFKRENEG